MTAAEINREATPGAVFTGLPREPQTWTRDRFLCFLCVAAGFFIAYGRSLSWGWLGLDDWRFIVTNPHLGHGWESVKWGLGDVQYGRRWMPVLWLVACACGAPTAFKFHLLVFVLGLFLSLLVMEIYGRLLGRGWAVAAALLFVMSPLRIEVFTWGMGFVYETVAILLCVAWLTRNRVWWSGLCVVLALGTYPQAAGAAVGYCLLNRKHLAGWVMGAFLLLLAVVEYRLRAEYGVIAWHQRFDYLPLILPHYALNLLLPFATVPIFPSLYYPLILVGALLIVVAALLRPSAVAWWILLFAPTLAASVTEGFWFGARYCLVPSIAAYGCLVYGVSQLKGKSMGFLVGLVILAFSVMNLRDDGMSRGVGLCALKAKEEAAFVAIDFDLLRTIRAQTPPFAPSSPAGQPPR